jgi:hypothetical protein
MQISKHAALYIERRSLPTIDNRTFSSPENIISLLSETGNNLLPISDNIVIDDQEFRECGY